ncbi:MAG: TonB-dependent receptor plug domain-containing protein, partial [Polaribacter sp.]
MLIIISLGSINTYGSANNKNFNIKITDRAPKFIFKEIESKTTFNVSFKEDNVINNNKPLVHQKKTNQQIQIHGTIVDNAGTPLPGASIIEKGLLGRATISDFDGKFTLKVSSEKSIIVISYVGFIKKEVVVGNKTQFNITLQEEISELDDVVVIGYQKVFRKEVTGAITSIGSKAIQDIPVISISQIIATQSSGIQGISLSGAPGSRGNLVIRGNTSLSTDLDPNTAYSNPLYVIDGVQTSLIDLAGYNASNLDFLASLNTNDIESINILKDASAAAIYGSRGANGVIIITTKKGGLLSKPEFEFSTSTGIQLKPDLTPMLVGET